jgi:hypothetical protein
MNGLRRWIGGDDLAVSEKTNRAITVTRSRTGPVMLSVRRSYGQSRRPEQQKNQNRSDG